MTQKKPDNFLGSEISNFRYKIVNDNFLAPSCIKRKIDFNQLEDGIFNHKLYFPGDSFSPEKEFIFILSEVYGKDRRYEALRHCYFKLGWRSNGKYIKKKTHRVSSNH